MPYDITIEPLSHDDRDALLALDQAAFGFDGRDLNPESETAVIEWDRAWGAFHEGLLAGIYVVFSFGLSVPARAPAVATVVPMAGLSWVAVHPDHRRRGVLTAMMRSHLDGVREAGKGEAVSGLFASESRIYGQFGYGMSTESRSLVLPAKTALRALRDPGSVRTSFEAVERPRHDEIVKTIHEAACRRRPGLAVRPAAHWERQLADRPSRRPGGAEALKILIAERDGQPTGYALMRRTAAWGENAPDGKLRVIDLQALDTQSAHALWRRLLDFDLMAEVTTCELALDDPLTVWSGESGPSSRRGSELWTRLVDVGSALATRGYRTDIDVVLSVTDEFCPWNAGRWRLTADASGAACERTSDAADLALDVRELGSAYLGGTTLARLGAAGLVDELTPGALTACSHAMRSDVLPASPFMF